MDPDRMRLRLELEELLVEFWYLVDHDRSDEVVELFTPDGYYEIAGERSTGHQALRAGFARRAARGERTSRHVLTNLRVDPLTADRPRVTSLMTLFARDGPPPHPAGISLVAEYVDTCVRGVDGRWKFAARVATGLFLGPPDAAAVTPVGSGDPHPGGSSVLPERR